jgi:hypothetical protein
MVGRQKWRRTFSKLNKWDQKMKNSGKTFSLLCLFALLAGCAGGQKRLAGQSDFNSVRNILKSENSQIVFNDGSKKNIPRSDLTDKKITWQEEGQKRQKAKLDQIEFIRAGDKKIKRHKVKGSAVQKVAVGLLLGTASVAGGAIAGKVIGWAACPQGAFECRDYVEKGGWIGAGLGLAAGIERGITAGDSVRWTVLETEF